MGVHKEHVPLVSARKDRGFDPPPDRSRNGARQLEDKIRRQAHSNSANDGRSPLLCRLITQKVGYENNALNEATDSKGLPTHHRESTNADADEAKRSRAGTLIRNAGFSVAKVEEELVVSSISGR